VGIAEDVLSVAKDCPVGAFGLGSSSLPGDHPCEVIEGLKRVEVGPAMQPVPGMANVAESGFGLAEGSLPSCFPCQAVAGGQVCVAIVLGSEDGLEHVFRFGQAFLPGNCPG
jgi:hypothetical protein